MSSTASADAFFFFSILLKNQPPGSCVSVRYLEDVWDGVVEMLPLLGVEVLQLGGVLVLALVDHVRPRVKVVFGLKRIQRGGVRDAKTGL